MSRARTTSAGGESAAAPPRAEGPSVLLLHGFGDDTTAVDAALRAVAAGARVMRVESVPALEAALRGRDWDLAIVGGRLESLGFDGVMARFARHDEDLPVIVAGRAIDDGFALRAAAAGALEVVDTESVEALEIALVDALRRGADAVAAEARLAGATGHVRALAELAAALHRAATVEEALRATVDTLGRRLELPYLETWCVDHTGIRARLGPCFEEGDGYAPLREQVDPNAHQALAGLVRSVVLGRRSRTLLDLSKDAAVFRRAGAALALGLDAVHAAPVLIDGRAAGALFAYGRVGQRLGPDDVTTVDTAAMHLGAAMARLTAEGVVEHERERTATLLDEVVDGIVACDAEGRLTFVNAAIETLHGGGPVVGGLATTWAARGDLLMHDGLTPVPPGEIPLLLALRGESFVDRQYVVDPPTGRSRVVRVSGRPVTGVDGERLGAVITVRDVTDRVAAETASAAAAERTLRSYTLLLDDLADLARGVGEAERMGEVWDAVLAFAHHTLRVDELGVVRMQPDGSLTPHYAAHVVPQRGPVPIDPSRAGPASPELVRAVEERTVVLAPTLVRDSLASGAPDAVRSLAAVPMVLKGGVLGGFEVRGYAPAAFDQGTAVALTMAANLAAIALDHDDLVDGERRAREAAETAARHFRQIFDASPAAVAISSLIDDRIIDVNPAMEALLGYSRADLVGLRGIDVGIWSESEDRAVVAEAARRREPVRGAEVRVRRKDGSIRTCLLSADAAELHGEPTMLVLIIDVSDRIEQQERLSNLARFRESLMTFIGETLDVGFDGPFYQRLLNSAVDATPNAQAGSLMVREAGGETYRFVAAVGYDLAGLQSVTFLDHEIAGVFDEDRAVTSDTLPTAAETDERAQVLRRHGRLDDIMSTLTVPIHLEGRRVASLSLDNFDRAGAFDDEAVQLAEAFASQVATLIKRRTLEHELEHMAYHDNLTGLPNRVLFRDRLRQAINRALRTQRRGAAIFLDLDNLKVTNDALGHAVGDALLVGVAQRLREAVRADDTVARIGGDEFTMVLPDVGGEDDAASVADKILRSLREPFAIGAHEIHVSASIGITLFPDDATDADAVIQHGDTAMYQAKAHGKDRYRFFTREMNFQILERASLEAHLRKALERGELQLHYQPRVALGNGRITSVEALARWNHPELGWISPGTFIPVAEDAGLIGAVGVVLLDMACAQAKAWERDGTPSIVAVNFSARQLQERDLVKTVRAALERTGLDPRLLEMELTESAIMHNVGENVVKLDELRSLGVSISIDDFGTAYSSLNYLKRLPATALKIDKSFINDIADAGEEGSHDTAIIRAVVALASALDLSTIAEGVETVEQLRFLRSVGCEQGQGYLFARPAAPEDLKGLLRAGTVGLPSG